MESHEVITH